MTHRDEPEGTIRAVERLFVCGCSHHQVPPSRLRPWASRRGEILARALALQREGRISGAVVLATCNRVEVVVDFSGVEPPPQTGVLAAAVLPALDGLQPRLLDGAEATRHLLGVATGLDSMAPGEDQILGQLQRAFREAEAHGLGSPRLRALRSRLLPAAREIRRRAGLPAHDLSLAAVAARAVLGAGPRLAVVGAGDTGRRAAEALVRGGASRLLLVNRTVARAQRLAAHLGCEAMSLAEFVGAPPACDGLLVALHTPAPLLDARQLHGVKRVVDLGMPPAVDAGVRDAGVELLGLDELADLARAGAEAHAASLAVAGELVRAQAHALCRGLDPRLRALGDVVQRHVATALALVEEELDCRLRHLGVEDRARVREIVLRSARRHAHLHIDDLKQVLGR